MLSNRWWLLRTLPCSIYWHFKKLKGACCISGLVYFRHEPKMLYADFHTETNHFLCVTQHSKAISLLSFFTSFILEDVCCASVLFFFFTVNVFPFTLYSAFLLFFFLWRVFMSTRVSWPLKQFLYHLFIFVSLFIPPTLSAVQYEDESMCDKCVCQQHLVH